MDRPDPVPALAGNWSLARQGRAPTVAHPAGRRDDLAVVQRQFLGGLLSFRDPDAPPDHPEPLLLADGFSALRALIRSQIAGQNLIRAGVGGPLDPVKTEDLIGATMGARHVIMSPVAL